MSEIARSAKIRQQHTAHDSSTSSCCADTPTSHGIRTDSLEPGVEHNAQLSESIDRPVSQAKDSHRSILKHIRYDEEANHAPTDVHLIQL